VPAYAEKAAAFIQKMDDTLQYHHDFIRANGEDIPEVQEWTWKPIK
jgi:xylulose-5-phosphate/fructose-6-phosphate phosphoketolase